MHLVPKANPSSIFLLVYGKYTLSFVMMVSKFRPMIADDIDHGRRITPHQHTTLFTSISEAINNHHGYQPPYLGVLMFYINNQVPASTVLHLHNDDYGYYPLACLITYNSLQTLPHSNIL
jgi:hypothetical protein